MKRAVLMSMKLEWWERILSGEKTLEIRKTVPDDENGKRFTWPLTVVVYVSGTGEVQGEFNCPGWIGTNMAELLEKLSCVPLKDLKAYAKGGSLYGWVVRNAREYYTPHTLEDFGVKRAPMSWQYIDLPF